MEGGEQTDDTQQAWNYYKQGKYSDSLAMLDKGKNLAINEQIMLSYQARAAG